MSTSPDFSPPVVIDPESTKLDRSIKGHPNPASATTQNAAAFVDKPSIPSVSSSLPPRQTQTANPPAQPKNPLDTHPTSPLTIYLNLLILEASFRKQYKKLHLRRRKYSFFLLLLGLWTSFFFHAVYIVGPSPYSAVSTFQKLGLLGGLVTGLLFWMSGLYAKTMIWPRRMVGNVNKGLRVFNVKLVVVKGGFWERFEGWFEIFYITHPLGWRYALGWRKVSVKPSAGSSARLRRESSTNPQFARRQLQGSISMSHRPPSPGMMPSTPTSTNAPPLSAAAKAIAQRTRSQSTTYMSNQHFEADDYLPSGTHVKLVILAKGFSADFREGWELYRTEYWEKENERRVREVEVIHRSLKETGQLPLMTSSGVIMSAPPPPGSSRDTHIPGIRGRPSRGASLSKNMFENSAAGSRETSRASTPGQETEESTGSSSGGMKGKIRIGRKQGGAQTLKNKSSSETLRDEDSSGTSSKRASVRSVSRKK